MAKRLALSSEELPLSELYQYKADAEVGLNLLFSQPNNKEELLFLTPSETENLLAQRIEELDCQASLALLTSLEAMFQIDFHMRVQRRWKDDLSREFRGISSHRRRISFERDIIKNWESFHPSTKSYFRPVKQALKYRHWLAHGRYWLLKHPKFMFDELYEIAEAIQNMLASGSR